MIRIIKDTNGTTYYVRSSKAGYRNSTVEQVMAGKKLFLIFVALCLLVSFASATPTYYLSEYNSYWKTGLHFNNSWVDSSPSAHTYTNASQIFTSDYKVFGSASDNVNSGTLTTGNSTDFDLYTGSTPSTIMFWMYPTSNSVGIAMEYYQDNLNLWYVTPQSGNIYFVSSASSTNRLRIEATGGSAYTTNQWQQVVVYLDGANSKIYVNGTDKTTSVPITLSMPSIAGTMYVGSGHSSGYMPGYIDEVNTWKGVKIPISELWPQSYEVGVENITAAPVSSFSGVRENTTNGVATIVFTDTTTNAPTSWNWTLQNVTGNNTQVSFSTLQSPTQSFGVGNFKILLNTSNSAGYNISSPYWVNVSYIAANFTGTPLSGSIPLSVTFTDSSTGSITNHSWFFGDESYNQSWVNKTNTTVPWVGRMQHSVVSLPNGHLVLFGGWNVPQPGVQTNYNDTWLSVDGGTTWTLQALHAPWVAREDMATAVLPDQSIVFLGGCQNGVANGWYGDVWRSTDEGVTWIEQNSSVPWGIGEGGGLTSLSDGTLIFAGGYTLSSTTSNNFVYKSTDKGVTWSLVNSSAAWSKRDGFTLNTLPDDSIILIGGSYWSDANLSYSEIYGDTWRSTDGGNIWTLQNASGGWLPRTHNSAVVMPDGSVVMGDGYNFTGAFPSATGGNFNDVWRSIDNGVTWNMLTSSAAWSPRSGTWFNLMPDGSVRIIGGISFTTAGIGTNYNDTWSFSPEGSTSANPIHTYESIGTYSVHEMITDGYFYNILTKPNYISTSSLPPIADFTYTPTSGATPLTVNFTDTSQTDITSWNWTFGAANYSSFQNPSYTFIGAGNYSVTLQVTNASGINSTTKYVLVTSVPDPNPTSMIKYKVGESSVAINNLSAPYTGTVTARNITSNTTYINGTFTWVTGNVFVDNIRVNTSSASISGASLISSSVDNSHGIGTFNFTKASGFTSPANALIDFNVTYVTYANPGTRINFSYTLAQCKYYDPGNSTWWTFNQYQGADAIIGVWGPITPTFTGSPTTVAIEDPVTFAASATGYPDAWSWNFGDGNTSTLQNPSHSYASIGNYTVSATAYLVENTSVTGTQTRTNYIEVVNATAPPVANFIAASTTIPLGGSAVFTDTSTNHPSSWSWNFGDGNTSTLQNPSHLYSSVGYYTVSLTATNDLGSNTTTKTNYIFVTYITPVASFTYSPSSGPYPLAVQFNDTSTNIPSSWSWNFGDGNTSTLQNPNHTYTGAGNFTVTLTATNTGGSNSTIRYVNVNIPSGAVRQDLQLIPENQLVLTIIDASTNQIIPVVVVSDSYGNNISTTTGVYTQVYPYGYITLYLSSIGYYPTSVSYAMDMSRTETVKLSGYEKTVQSATTWYSPKTVQFQIVDAYGNQLNGATINAQYNSTTLPYGVTDLINNYGMNVYAANEALNGTLIMNGTTDSMGSVVFTMMSTIKYDISISYGGNTNTYSFYPQQDNYQLKFIVPVATDNIWNDLYANGNTKVWATEPDIGNVTFWWSFQDMTALTTRIDFYLKDVDLNTTVYQTNVTSPVAGSIYQLNYTVLNERGKNYIAWENYTRSV